MVSDINMNVKPQNANADVVRDANRPGQPAPSVEPVGQVNAGKGTQLATVQGRQVVSGQRQNIADSKESASEKLQENLEDTVAKLNDSIQSVNRDLQFSVDDNAGRIVVQVLDSETEEVIRQIPSEDVLELARRLREMQDNDKGDSLLLEVKV